MYKNDLKQTWCMINNVLCRSKSDSISNSFIINGEEINDPQIIADNFNDLFINVGGPQLINSDSQYKKYLNGDVCSNFKFELVTNEQIIQIIEGLKSKRSSGYDGLFSILLKQIKCEIFPYLTLLLNPCLTTGIFPEKLKIAKIIPI